MKKNKKNAHKRQRASQKPAQKPKTQAQKLPRASLYGFHAVAEAWMNEAREIKALYATDQGLKSFEDILQKSKNPRQ